MNKAELIEQMADKAGISKVAAGRALDAMVETVKESLVQGENVTILGFGTFSISEREAREGRNPRTGETININSSKIPKFRAGKSLKDAVN